MTIGFLGNANNYPFLMACAIQRLGHQVRFLVDRPERLHRPEYRYPALKGAYPPWIVEVPTLEVEDVVWRTAAWRRAIEALADCEAVVLNGLGIAMAGALGRPAVCLLTGSDLEFYADEDRAEAFARDAERRHRPRDWIRHAYRRDFRSREDLLSLYHRLPTPLYRSARKATFRHFARAQAAGIRGAVAVTYFPEGAVAVGDRLLARLRGRSPRLFVMVADIDGIGRRDPPHNPVLRVFNATRWEWQRPFPPMVGAWEDKGNDALLHGIARFHRRTGVALDARFVEKGQSTQATKQLATALGIAHLVTWSPELSQEQVIAEYYRADVVAEQFGGHVVGLAGYEAMASGRPVLANWRPEVFGPAFGEHAPIVQARTAEEIDRQLERLLSAARRVRLGAAGRAFVERHLSPLAAARRILCALATGSLDRRRAS